MVRNLIFMLLLLGSSANAQDIRGTVVDAQGQRPAEFVNVGIRGKNIGTVTDERGRFSLVVDAQYDQDTVLFSMLGYETKTVTVSDLRKPVEHVIQLVPKVYELAEAQVKPRIFKERILGVRSTKKWLVAGFAEDRLGDEYGILMKAKKAVFLKQLNLNVAQCTYDTVFFRLNVYEVRGEMDFVNILREPIYIKLAKSQIQDKIEVDLVSRNIVVEGDLVVALEHVKDLGEGNLMFCAGLSEKTYFRKTSQGNWQTSPVGISLSVVADVEK